MSTQNAPASDTPQPATAPHPPATSPEHSAASPDTASPRRTHRRTGKIACLPKRLRDLLNRRLRDGVRYADLARELSALGHDITPDNLSRWHTGSHQEWLKEQACLEEVRDRVDFANTVLERDQEGRISEASLRIAVTRMYCLLTAFDPSTLTEKLAASPDTYARLLAVLARLTNATLKFERHREQQRQNQELEGSSLLPPIPTSSPANPH